MDERLKKIRKQINGLLQWKKDMARNQVPIASFGKQSQTIMRKDQMILQSVSNVVSPYTYVNIEVIIGGRIFLVPAFTN